MKNTLIFSLISLASILSIASVHAMEEKDASAAIERERAAAYQAADMAKSNIMVTLYFALHHRGERACIDLKEKADSLNQEQSPAAKEAQKKYRECRALYQNLINNALEKTRHDFFETEISRPVDQ